MDRTISNWKTIDYITLLNFGTFRWSFLLPGELCPAAHLRHLWVDLLHAHHALLRDFCLRVWWHVCRNPGGFVQRRLAPELQLWPQGGGCWRLQPPPGGRVSNGGHELVVGYDFMSGSADLNEQWPKNNTLCCRRGRSRGSPQLQLITGQNSIWAEEVQTNSPPFGSFIQYKRLHWKQITVFGCSSTMRCCVCIYRRVCGQ